jgi:3-hydroxyisobutyrate dehydrogenase
MIGFIGVGSMGLAMAQRLRDADWPVAAFDIDPVRLALAQAAGCMRHDSAASLAAACDVVIVAVVDGAQLRQALLGAHGAAQGLRPGATVLVCPTVSPGDVEHVAEALQALGVDVIDAPMSGGPQRARAGTMSLMLAGADAVIQRHMPLLERLSSRLFRVGTRPGDGARTKLVNNLLAAANLAAAAEALALARALGLDPATTLDVIGASSGASWIGDDRGRRAIEGDAAVHARIALLAKDSALALAEAGDAAAALPLGRAAAACFADAVEAGLVDADDSALFSRLHWAVAAARSAPDPGPR